MVLFPFYEDVEHKTFLLVGGGKVATDKLEKLLRFTDKIRIVAKETEISGLPVERRAFRDSDLEGIDVCVVATSDRELNRHIAFLCREKGIPVNVVDDRALCSFIFPSFIKKGDLTVSITTAGKSPAYARRLRQELEQIIPGQIEEILDRMDSYRSLIPVRVKQQKNRSLLYKKILNRLLETENQVTEEEIEEMIAAAEAGERS